MITLKEIADRCQVSTSTVSNILNGKPKVSEETKRRVLDVIRETGYQPNYFAQGMRKQKTRMIGIMVEDLDQFSSPKIIEGIMAYAEEHNYRTILVNMRLYDRWGSSWYNQEKMYQSILEPSLQEMVSVKVDGVIYVAGHARIINCFPDDFKLPGVVAYGYSMNPHYPSVVIDDEKGGYDATIYLLEKGHRKIGVIGGAADNIHTVKRTLGYQKALFEWQILFNPELIQNGNWDRASAYPLAKKLIEEGVTAIFCMNDEMVAGVYDYLYEENMQPGKDVAVMGYDNRELSSYMRPTVTTMDIPLTAIGATAAERMISLLDMEEKNEEEHLEVKLVCTLVERESVHSI